MLNYAWKLLTIESIFSGFVAFIITYFFNKNTEIFNINWALYERRKKVLGALNSFFSFIPVGTLSVELHKAPIDVTNLKIELEDISRESEKIFYPELHYNIVKTLFYINEAAYKSHKIFENSPEKIFQTIREYLYNQKEISQFYWDQIYKGEKTLSLEKMSSLTFFMWNYKIKPFLYAYEKREILENMFQIVQIYKNMFEEFIRGEGFTMSHEKSSALASLGCYHNEIRRFFGKKTAACFYELEEKIAPCDNSISKDNHFFYNEFKNKIYWSFFWKSPFLYVLYYRRRLHKLFTKTIL